MTLVKAQWDWLCSKGVVSQGEWGPLQCVLLWRREPRFNFKHSGKWEFIAQEQDGGQWMKNYQQETRQVRGILVKLL